MLNYVMVIEIRWAELEAYKYLRSRINIRHIVVNDYQCTLEIGEPLGHISARGGPRRPYLFTVKKDRYKILKNGDCLATGAYSCILWDYSCPTGGQTVEKDENFNA